MRTRITTAATIAALLALAGCTSTSTPPVSSDQATTSPAAAATMETPAPPSPTDEPPMAIGASWAWQQGDGSTLSGSITVLGYRQHVATDGATPEDAFGSSSHGYVWAALEVKICNDKTSSEADPVDNSSWTLAYDDGSQIQPSDTGYDNFPKPAFPMGDATVTPGHCLRGKIVFPVPGKQRPSLVAYAPAGLDVPKVWTVPTK